MRQTENCNCGNKEGECSALDDGQTTSKGDLEQSEESRDKEEGGDDVAPSRIIISDAQKWTQNERNGDSGAKHCQIMLQSQNTAGVPATFVVNVFCI